ncbi:hypothetical protein CK505_17085 [Kocuria sp. WN036]|nr:hypothetical protein CK505_17085 [Kocuria sp. WN036]
MSFEYFGGASASSARAIVSEGDILLPADDSESQGRGPAGSRRWPRPRLHPAQSFAPSASLHVV